MHKGNILSFKATRKTHAIMLEKAFISLYLQHIYFVMKRARLLVTKIDSPYTFDQELLDKNLILMNQKPRQEAKIDEEKDFYQLLNNSNFFCDCINNTDNYVFEPIFDEIMDAQNKRILSLKVRVYIA